MTILTSTYTVLLFIVSAGCLGMAIWAWRTFRISVLMWLAIQRIAFGFTVVLTLAPDRAKLESGIKALQTQSDLSLPDLFTLTSHLTGTFPALSSLALLLIALGEISHFGPSITPTYQPHWILTTFFRLRHLLGLLAVTFSIAPSVAAYLWYHSLA